MDIMAALDDKFLLGTHFQGPSWDGWRAFMRALFGLPMDDASLATYRTCTGRVSPPSKQFAEACVIVGRRGGKSVSLAVIAVFLAVFKNYEQHLAPGEVATILVIASNRAQARSIFRYISGLLHAGPFFAQMIVDENTEAITLNNRVVVEIGTASFRVTRGYSYGAVLADEVAFFRSEESSANMDQEIMRAIRPGMASIPGSMLLMASSPYAKRGELYNVYRKHYGKDDARILVWKADTATMNPRIPADIIQEAYESDPQAADAEYGANFRSDIADYISREAIDEVTMHGRQELPPCPDLVFAAFCDPSGGSNDSFTLAIGHRADDGVGVLDHLTEIRAPYDPEQAVATCAAVLNRYGITRVVGDRYASEWPKSRFASAGISFEQNAMPKSDIYANFLPLVNSKKVALLDNARLVAQLCGLERRTARSGKDSIDHGPGAKDDVCNVACGVLVGLDLDRRQPLVRQSDMLVDSAALPIPPHAKYIVACLAADKFGSSAVVYSAVGHEGVGAALTLIDFEVSPISLSVFPKIGNRVSELAKQCRARGSCVFVWPSDLVNHARAVGLACADMPDDLEPEQLLLSASNHVSAGKVKLCEAALEKSRTSTFGAALDLRAAENADDPLRAAALLTIALSLDIPQ